MEEREALLKAVGGSVAKARETAGRTLAATARRASISKAASNLSRRLARPSRV